MAKRLLNEKTPTKKILSFFCKEPDGKYIGTVYAIFGAIFIWIFLFFDGPNSAVGILLGPAYFLLAVAESLPPSRLRAIAVFRVAAVAYFLVLFILWGLEVL